MAPHGVSRRTTTSATRHIPRYLTSSTLWYSGIFAAAATFDAGAKKQRRRQWDSAIAEVKQDLAQPSSVENHPTDALEESVVARDDTLKCQPMDELLALEDNLDSSALRQYRPFWPTNTGSTLNVHHLPPESIYATDYAKHKRAQTRWHPKKLERVQLSIDILQLELFAELQDRGWSHAAALSVPSEYGEKILMPTEERASALGQKLEDLKVLGKIGWLESPQEPLKWQRSESDVALCKYHQDDLGQFHNTAQRLNRSLQDLFKLQEKREISTPELLAKLAYNLHISSAPPNVDTFNTLILGFSRAQEVNQARNVVSAFRLAHMRPNEVSLAAILGLYTATDDVENFRYWIKLMRGKKGGLAEARKDIRITESGASRLLRKGEKVLQLPYPTPMVFGALINGVLKFSGFDAALDICKNMGHEGWGLCMSGLGPLLQDCAERGDWDSGLVVWNQIQALKSSERSRTKQGWTSEVIALPTFVSMLQLCSSCGRRDVFQDVMDQASKTHKRASIELIKLVRTPNDPSGAWESLVAQTGPAQDLVSANSSRDASHRQNVTDHVHKPAALCTNGTSSMTISPDKPGAVPREPELRSQPDCCDVGIDHDAALRPSQERRSLVPHQRKALQQTWVANHQNHILDQNQLLGFLPMGRDLEEYELRERPMHLSG